MIYKLNARRNFFLIVMYVFIGLAILDVFFIFYFPFIAIIELLVCAFFAILCFCVAKNLKLAIDEELAKDEEKAAKERERYAKMQKEAVEGKDFDTIPSIIFTDILKYLYEKPLSLVPGAIGIVKGNGGQKLSFIAEPDNPDNAKAIAVYFKEQKIGYVGDATTCSMIHDWTRRDEVYIGYLNRINLINNTVTYKIGFYKPAETFEHKTFPLRKIGKRIDEDITRRENFDMLSDGDEVLLQFDAESDCYFVYDEAFNEVGELGDAANDFIDDENEVVCVINDVYDDGDRPTAKVTVYK